MASLPKTPFPPGYDASDALAVKAGSEVIPDPYRVVERYRAFAENSSDGIWLCEADSPIPIYLPEDEQIARLHESAYLVECNSAMARMHGLPSAQELIGARLDALFRREDPSSREYLRMFIRAGYRLTDAEFSERGPDGETRYYTSSLQGIVENGFLLRAWGTQRDITRQKRAEEALRATAEALRATAEALLERETRFLRLADAAPILIYMTDTDGRGTYFNRTWLEFRGHSLDEETGRGYMRGVHPEDRQRLQRTKRRARRSRKPFTAEYRLCSQDGEYRWVLDNSVPFYEPDGSYSGYFGSCVDITDRKQAEADRTALHAEQRRFLREMLFGLTGGRLSLCDSRDSLPEPPAAETLAPPMLLTAETLSDLRNTVRVAGTVAALPVERLADLLTAVGEAAMNAVVHAGGGEGFVYVDSASGRVQVWVSDRGRGIAEESLHRATLERGFTTNGTLGHGFWLMLRTVDRLFLLTGKTGTTIVLEQTREEIRPPWMEGL